MRALPWILLFVSSTCGAVIMMRPLAEVVPDARAAIVVRIAWSEFERNDWQYEQFVIAERRRVLYSDAPVPEWLACTHNQFLARIRDGRMIEPRLTDSGRERDVGPGDEVIMLIDRKTDHQALDGDCYFLRLERVESEAAVLALHRAAAVR